MENLFIDPESVITLRKTQSLIEELLETIDVLADKEALTALKESAADKKSGRTRTLKKFLAETNV